MADEVADVHGHAESVLTIRDARERKQLDIERWQPAQLAVDQDQLGRARNRRRDAEVVRDLVADDLQRANPAVLARARAGQRPVAELLHALRVARVAGDLRDARQRARIEAARALGLKCRASVGIARPVIEAPTALFARWPGVMQRRARQRRQCPALPVRGAALAGRSEMRLECRGGLMWIGAHA